MTYRLGRKGSTTRVRLVSDDDRVQLEGESAEAFAARLDTLAAYDGIWLTVELVGREDYLEMQREYFQLRDVGDWDRMRQLGEVSKQHALKCLRKIEGVEVGGVDLSLVSVAEAVAALAECEDVSLLSDVAGRCRSVQSLSATQKKTRAS